MQSSFCQVSKLSVPFLNTTVLALQGAFQHIVSQDCHTQYGSTVPEEFLFILLGMTMAHWFMYNVNKSLTVEIHTEVSIDKM